mgnify:CR=1 FL=1
MTPPLRTAKLLGVRALGLASWSPGCWEIREHRDACGYGRFRWGPRGRRREAKAHRMVWVLLHGRIPRGLEVAHRCDNPACVRPDHLFLATHAENMADMARKDRAHRARGEASPVHKLTEAEVRRMRKLAQCGRRSSYLAQCFGVARSTVYDVLHRRRWAHI